MLKKKNKSKQRILNLYIIAILVVSLITGVLYAKYITVINANSSMPVGKWIFKVNGSDEEDIGTINLGHKTYTAETLANGNLAPGTEGAFAINIDATGISTGVNYSVEFKNIINKPTNLYFKINDDIYYDFDSLQNALSGSIYPYDTNKTRNIIINWAWDYETNRNGSTEYNDEIDTKEGKDAKTFSFDITVTGTQMLPAIKKV